MMITVSEEADVASFKSYTSSPTTAAPTPAAAPPAPPTKPATPPSPVPTPITIPTPTIISTTTPVGGRVFASPLAKSMAKAAGIHIVSIII